MVTDTDRLEFLNSVGCVPFQSSTDGKWRMPTIWNLHYKLSPASSARECIDKAIECEFWNELGGINYEQV
jgi:hypothetical protein